MASASEAKAEKHIRIALKVRRIAQDWCPDWSVYAATYTAGRSGQTYQRLEEDAGSEFWSIRANSQAVSPTMYADVLITHGDSVHLVVEIKWGAVPGSNETDMLRTHSDWMRMAAALHDSAWCRVRGPAVAAGQRHRSAAFPVQRDYSVDDDTRLLVVTDLQGMKRLNEERYEEVLHAWKHVSGDPSLLLADINAQVDKIPSLRDVLTG